MHLEVIVALNDIESKVFPKDLTDRNYESNKKVHEVEKALEIPDQLLDRQIENPPNTNGAFRNVLMLIDLYHIAELVEIEDQRKKGHLMPFRILEY